jgi:hypothetical protein
MNRDDEKDVLNTLSSKNEHLSGLARDVARGGVGYTERQRAELWESAMNEVSRCFATPDQAVFLRTLLEVFGQEMLVQQELLKRAPKGAGRSFGVTANQASQMG